MGQPQAGARSAVTLFLQAGLWVIGASGLTGRRCVGERRFQQIEGVAFTLNATMNATCIVAKMRGKSSY